MLQYMSNYMWLSSSLKSWGWFRFITQNNILYIAKVKLNFQKTVAKTRGIFTGYSKLNLWYSAMLRMFEVKGGKRRQSALVLNNIYKGLIFNCHRSVLSVLAWYEKEAYPATGMESNLRLFDKSVISFKLAIDVFIQVSSYLNCT